MSVPCLAIVVFSGLLLLSALIRLVQAVAGRESRCDIGCSKTIGSREIQEDFYQVVRGREGLLAVLADGMGKELGGKIAARKVTEVFAELFQEYNALDHPFYFFQKAFQTANREVLKLFEDGRGSAVASVVMLRESPIRGEYPQMYYAIVGNVRVAVLRNGELIPVGSGHTINVLAQDKYYSGDITREDALALLNVNRIYNYMGRDNFKDIEFYDTPVQLKKDDVVVLMSDGIYEGMEWKELEEYLNRPARSQQLAFDVIEHINRKTEDKDNAGIVLLRVGELL
ncbi:MAG: SpoIIE family protein phosphatase [Lachnospiraceae bacterium]|nr:SpoIIE family protein phosphatase [Lachnospiraceae bacterium]